MKFKQSFLVLSALLNNAFAYSYKSHGDDWVVEGADCDPATTPQSPIDLTTMANENFKMDVIRGVDKDNLVLDYTNQKKAKFATDTKDFKAFVNLKDTNTFQSDIAESVFGGAKSFSAPQFEFHANSEHTIDGVQYDLEMQVYHDLATANESAPIQYAGTSILFSVDKYTKENVTELQQEVLDTFFTTIGWDKMSSSSSKKDYTVDLISFGSVMSVVDSTKRWVYQGSKTTPPCEKGVYWNVLSTVYPISQQALENFQKKILIKGEKKKLWTSMNGNYRNIQTLTDDHKLSYVTSEELLVTIVGEDGLPYNTLVLIAIVLAILCVLFMLLFCRFVFKVIALGKELNQIGIKPGQSSEPSTGVGQTADNENRTVPPDDATKQIQGTEMTEVNAA